MTREAVRNLASAAFVMTQAGLIATGDYETALLRCNAWFAMVGWHRLDPLERRVTEGKAEAWCLPDSLYMLTRLFLSTQRVESDWWRLKLRFVKLHS
jgi:hypothetical protein